MRGIVVVVVTLLCLCHVTSAAVPRNKVARRHKFRVKGIQLFRSEENTNKKPTPDEVFRTYGYHGETHTIKTEDGYLLGVHRVYNQTAVRLFNRPEPFLLQHGLVSNSAQWIVLEPKQNLVAMLADAGYDCWMTNTRGVKYSQKHETLSTDSAEFWDYEWHENGVLDIPAMVDYILNRTGYKQLWYVGHSMGTTMFFVMNSMKPEYNDKIKHAFLLSPVAYMGNLKSAVRNLAPSARVLQEMVKRTMNDHFSSELMESQAEILLPQCKLLPEQCGQILSDAGFNSKINLTIIEAARGYVPDAISSKQAVHYAQGINNPDTFRLYDHYEKNMEIYGAATPPDYPVDRITAPITLIYSTHDALVAKEDVENFSKRLKNVKLYLVPDSEFNHMDFIIHPNADKLVYTPMMNIINSATRK